MAVAGISVAVRPALEERAEVAESVLKVVSLNKTREGIRSNTVAAVV